MAEKKYTEVLATEDVTDEIIDIVLNIVEGWYAETRIDWENVWERADGTELDDGTLLDLGPELDSPALRKIQRSIRTLR